MMATPTQKHIIAALLEEYGRTFSDELGIKLENNMPSELFRWLCAAMLFSARISSEIAVKAAKALSDHGWTTPQKMASATWAQRTRVLNRAGYARYDEKTSRMLGDSSELLLERYKGDLRNLREDAERNPEKEHELIQEFTGIGKVGADIFFREMQVAWTEWAPFVDEVARKFAKQLDLPNDAQSLAKYVPGKEFPRLLAALVRCGLAKDQKSIIDAADQHSTRR